MNSNRISTAIPQEVIAQVKDQLNNIKTLLQPYLQSLTTEQRRDLPKMSNKSLSFVSKVNDYCHNNAEFCPSYFSREELEKDFAVAAALGPVHDLCEQICMNMDDTIMLAGSEAYTASLIYYGSVQMAAKTGQANAKPIYEDLHERFAGMGKRKKAGIAAE